MSKFGYVLVEFDGLNKTAQECQMDIVVRFWYTECQRVKTHYWDSRFMAHLHIKTFISCWGDEIDLFKNGLCSTFYIVNACAQAAFLVGDVMLLTMAFKKVRRMAGNQQCKIKFMFAT